MAVRRVLLTRHDFAAVFVPGSDGSELCTEDVLSGLDYLARGAYDRLPPGLRASGLIVLYAEHRPDQGLTAASGTLLPGTPSHAGFDLPAPCLASTNGVR